MSFILDMALTTLLLSFFSLGTYGQMEVPKIETGLHCVTMKLPDPIGEGAVGVGGRFGRNLSNYFGLEAELNHFPGGTPSNPNFGETEGLFGIKAGIGKRDGGIFGKVRPGFIHFPKDSAAVNRGLRNQNYFAVDLGVVAERYWGNHAYFRFDAGDTVISYGGERYLDAFGRVVPLGTTNNLQIAVGFGLSF